MKARAYGKILIFGAYSILEPGNIGYVATIDKGTTTEAKETDSGKIVIDLTNFQISITGDFKNKILKFDKENKELTTFIKNAINYTFEYLSYKKIKIKDVKLLSINDPEFSVNRQKTGLGSSSTSVVSAVAAILALHDINERDIVFKISRYAHFKAQNNSGSGYDIAAACYGSHFFISDRLTPNINFFDYLKKEDYLKREFNFPFSFFPVLIFLNRQVSTQEFVKKALEFKDKKPKDYELFMYEYNQINNNAKYAIETNNLKKLKFYLEESWQKRKEFGKMANLNIETDSETNFINSLKKKGAFIAGIIGAGGDSVLALCNAKSDKENLIKFLENTDYPYIEFNFIDKGYEII